MNTRNNGPNSTMAPAAAVSTVTNGIISSNEPMIVSSLVLGIINNALNAIGTYSAVSPLYAANNGSEANGGKISL